MSELSFLLDILLNHKLGKATKDAIKARIDHITNLPIRKYEELNNQLIAQQAAPQTYTVRPIEPVQPMQIGQTPAAQAALQHRAEMIRQAQTGKPAKGFDTPPKAHGTL